MTIYDLYYSVSKQVLGNLTSNLPINRIPLDALPEV